MPSVSTFSSLMLHPYINIVPDYTPFVLRPALTSLRQTYEEATKLQDVQLQQPQEASVDGSSLYIS
jgi:hypothetical protein